MGAMTARELAEIGSDNLEQSLEFHLVSNHFPPVPVSMVPVCVEAIQWASAGEWDRLIRLPDGVGYKGLTAAPVFAIVEAHHLESWLS